MPSTHSRILVTGGKGFIGRKLCAMLMGAIVRDKPWVPVEQPIDGIIHLAAVSRVKDGEADPVECVRSNIVFTAEMLALAAQNKAWFVLLGTQEEGENFYGMTKDFSEAYAKRYASLHGFPLAIIRPANVWGDGDNPDRLIPKMAAAAKEGRQLRLDRKRLKITHVDEVIEAILERIGTDCEYDVPGDDIRLESLGRLMRYVAAPDPQAP